MRATSIPLDVPRAPHVGELSVFVGTEHQCANLGEVLFEAILGVELRCPPATAPRTRLTSSSTEERDGVHKLATEPRQIGF
jgi:hypothetical protein